MERTQIPVYSLLAERIRIIGREADSASLHVWLLDPAISLVTITGPGGIGKTTLALQVASELLTHYADGITFVDLTPLSDPALIPLHIARAAGLEETGDRPIDALLIDHLRYQHTLLLIDNFEHLLDGATFVGELLRACPRLQVLATSREPLRLHLERVFPLGPLALPDKGEMGDPTALANVAAVELFTRHAVAVRPDFALTTGNVSAVAGIVRRLDGLPLAIELAAARIRLFPPAALLARLESSPLGVLTGGARDMPARQQTIRVTIGWSYELLEPAEARMFRRLGVFANGFTIEAANAVAADAFADTAIDAPTVLESLLDKSLVLRLPAGDEPRLGLLETLRAFALEQLAAVGELEIARRAHFDYYLALAEEAGRHYRGPAMDEWMGRVAAEEDNLRAALHWTMDGSGTDEFHLRPAIRLAGAMGDFWMFGSRNLEGKMWLERVLNRYAPWDAFTSTATVEDHERARVADDARVYSAAGSMAWLNGEFIRAKQYHTEALARYQAIGDLQQAADSRHNLAVQYQILKEHDVARSLSEENVAYYSRMENWEGLGRSHLNLALLSFDLQQYEDARKAYAEGLIAARRTGYELMIHSYLINMAQLELMSGNLDRVEMLLEQELKSDVLSIVQYRIDANLAFGRLREMQDRHGDALSIARDCLALSHSHGYRDRIADSLEQAAFALHGLGNSARAARILGAASALRERMGSAAARDQVAYYNERLPRLRAALGDERFEAEWNAGQTLSREAAMAVANEELPATGDKPSQPANSGDTQQSAAGSRSPVAPLTALTPREREVALLMARGRSNEEIAAELFITLKTVEKHAGNVLGKLGFRNRVELAAWWAQQGRAS